MRVWSAKEFLLRVSCFGLADLTSSRSSSNVHNGFGPFPLNPNLPYPNPNTPGFRFRVRVFGVGHTRCLRNPQSKAQAP